LRRSVIAARPARRIGRPARRLAKTSRDWRKRRLVFRFGGFSGYDGIDSAVPAELAHLRDGLIQF